jgi:DNA-binding response OmpR family regulator
VKPTRQQESGVCGAVARRAAPGGAGARGCLIKLLLVEDSAKLSQFLVRAFREEGYVVDQCTSGADGLAQAASGVYDVIVLDWMLPDLDGIAVCRELRRRGTATPVLMLTARGETRERVLGLDAGADDYLVKPFELEELLARVRALVRRAGALTRLRCGALELDPSARRVTLNGRLVNLTTREYALLLYLVRKPDRPVSRTELLSQVWQTHFDPSSNILEVHVSRLRDKLGDAAWMIETVRGIGYRMRSQA